MKVQALFRKCLSRRRLQAAIMARGAAATRLQLAYKAYLAKKAIQVGSSSSSSRRRRRRGQYHHHNSHHD